MPISLRNPGLEHHISNLWDNIPLMKLFIQRWTLALAAAACLTASLTACGGGASSTASTSTSSTSTSSSSTSSTGSTSSTATTPPVVAPSVTVALLAPAASANVVDLGSPVTVTARVTVGTGAAAEGTAVQFSATAGSFAAISAGTVGGQASASLVGSTAGAQQVTARATVDGQSGAATATVYIRPTPARLEVLVPAYWFPSASSPWGSLTSATTRRPGVTVNAILNPNNGIFTTADAAFVTAATAFANAGGKLLGYVYTGYGTGSRSLADIKANVDAYLSLYGRGLISGIFLDEMASDASRLAFYREIHAYIKGRDATLRVVGNPGLIPAAGYAAVADVLVTFEDTGAAYASYDPRTAATWLYTLPNSAQAMLAHGVATCAAMQTALTNARSARNNAGLVYATDDVFSTTPSRNPWDTLPGYFDTLLQTVQALNAGTALPAC